MTRHESLPGTTKSDRPLPQSSFVFDRAVPIHPWFAVSTESRAWPCRPSETKRRRWKWR
jgi:hypothetical protein